MEKVKKVDGYQVYRYNKSTKKYQKVATVKTNTYTDKNSKQQRFISIKCVHTGKAVKDGNRKVLQCDQGRDQPAEGDCG